MAGPLAEGCYLLLGARPGRRDSCHPSPALVLVGDPPAALAYPAMIECPWDWPMACRALVSGWS